MVCVERELLAEVLDGLRSFVEEDLILLLASCYALSKMWSRKTSDGIVPGGGGRVAGGACIMLAWWGNLELSWGCELPHHATRPSMKVLRRLN